MFDPCGVRSHHTVCVRTHRTEGESEVAFGRAALLLLGPWFGVSAAVSTWRAMLKKALALPIDKRFLPPGRRPTGECVIPPSLSLA